MQDLDVTAQLWGVTYYQIWAKEKGYAAPLALIHGLALSRGARKTTRRLDILGQLRTVSKFVSGKTGSSMDFTKASKL